MKKSTIKSIYYIFFVALVASFVGASAKASEQTPLISPVPYSSTSSFSEYKQPEMTNLKDQQKAIAIIKQTWRKDYKTGIVIASCESGLRERVIGVTRDIGYFQISPVHGFTDEQMQNGVANASFAYTLYKEQKLQPWISSRNCWKEKI